MSFDLRLPIGLLFAVFGVILAIDGLVAHSLVLDINVNLWWGLVHDRLRRARCWAWLARARKAARGSSCGEVTDDGPRRPH